MEGKGGQGHQRYRQQRQHPAAEQPGEDGRLAQPRYFG